MTDYWSWIWVKTDRIWVKTRFLAFLHMDRTPPQATDLSGVLWSRKDPGAGRGNGRSMTNERTPLTSAKWPIFVRILVVSQQGRSLVLANNSLSALRWENPKTKGVRRTVLFLGPSWSFSRHRFERQEWRNSSVRRAEQPERRQFGASSSSIPLTRRCALRVQTKALCGSGKGQPGPRGSEERSVLSFLRQIGAFLFYLRNDMCHET
ncbi:hypothetical protein Krac_3121 [Ktedonobacter racemifer DSM 44963]|uniref:Uncharacterized protein n=1 Tax=Ktedonobacter racemifer DSM 44963 TaxID=485913 RepID=D6U0I0_KTERA|nr:hypothetical protein Krac_3121 [Ktedonobacter racemifer DSM 44963]